MVNHNFYKKVKLDKAYIDDYPKDSKWARSKIKRLTKKEIERSLSEECVPRRSNDFD